MVATVSSASQNINLSKEYKVAVVDADDYAKVTAAKLVFNEDVTGSVITLDDTAKLVPTKAIKNDGKELDATKTNIPDEVKWDGQVKSVESSNVKVLTTNFKENTINLVPVSSGDATITVTLNSGYKFTKTIEVKEEKRKPAVVKVDKEKLTLSSTVNSGSVKVTLLDQYGDPVKGSTVYAHPGKTGDISILNSAKSETTNAKGESTLQISAVANALTGNDTMKLSVDADAKKDGIGTLSVDYAKAGNVASYDLRISSDSKSKDAIIDKYSTSDNELKLQFIGKDANKVVAKVFDKKEIEKDYTVSSSDKTIAEAKVQEDGTITVTPAKAGDATVIVKEGSIVRATFAVKVIDSTPSVGTIELAKSARLMVKSDNNTGYTIDNAKIKELVKVENFKLEHNGVKNIFEVKDGENVIGTVDIISSDNTLVTVTDNKTVKTTENLKEDSKVSLIFRLKDNSQNIKHVIDLPLTVDNTQPTVLVTGIETGKKSATKNFSTNAGLSATSVAKGVDGNKLKVAIIDTKNNNTDIEVSVAGDTITIDPANDTLNQAIKSKLSEIVDAVNSNEEAKAKVQLAVTDEKKDTLAQAEEAITLAGGEDELVVTLTFSEPVNKAEAENPANYTYKHDGQVSADLQPTVKVSEDNKSVVLTYKIDEAAKAKKLQKDNSKVSINNKIVDEAGNAIKDADAIIK